MKGNQIQIFEHPMFGQLRSMKGEDGEVWFVGKDVTRILGYKNASKVICSRVDEEDKTILLIQQSGSNYKTNTALINESAFYSLILSSQRPQAKAFKRWVTSEVLPQIRCTGGYTPIDQEDDEKTILAKAVGILKRTLKQRESLIAALEAYMQFAEAVTSAEDSILIREGTIRGGGIKTLHEEF